MAEIVVMMYKKVKRFLESFSRDYQKAKATNE